MQRKLKTDVPVRVCAFIEIDTFYAQAESRRLGLDDSVPLAAFKYNVILSVNHSAESLGVKRGWTPEEAKKVCPDIVMAHVDTLKLDILDEDSTSNEKDIKSDKFEVKERNFEKVTLDYYRFESERIFDVIMKRCNIVEKASIDGVFLDLTTEAYEMYKSNNYEKCWKGKIIGGEMKEPENEKEISLMIGSQIVEKIRQEVKAIYNYTCSAGISFNKMLAKLGSGLNKPDGQAVILEKYVIEALKPVEIRKIRNFGGKIGYTFETAGFSKVYEIFDMSLEQLKKIVEDDQTANYVYFRIRGFDDEPIKEKDFKKKIITSQKVFNKTSNSNDIEKILDLVIADLATRVSRFYEQYHLVPHTLTFQYFDQVFKERRTKSVPINLNKKKDLFQKALKDKAHEVIKSVWDVLLPCGFLGVSVKNFEQNNMDTFQFDLLNYAKQEKEKRMLEKQCSLGNNSNCIKDIEIIQYQELILCDQCGQKVPIEEIMAHKDFHIAEDLDKELNPNKRKYKKLEEKSEEKLMNNPYNNAEKEKRQGKKKEGEHESKKVKKSKPQVDEKTTSISGNIGVGKNITLDKFFKIES